MQYCSPHQFSSVAQSCLTLCMDCSMSGFPVHHQLPEPAQTHVHRVPMVSGVKVSLQKPEVTGLGRGPGLELSGNLEPGPNQGTVGRLKCLSKHSCQSPRVPAPWKRSDSHENPAMARTHPSGFTCPPFLLSSF